MLVILTEDKKSGKRFWETVAKTLIKDCTCVCCTDNGNTDFLAKTKQLYSEEVIKKGDKLFIAVDNIIPTSDKVSSNYSK
jgi:hypothetical protein